MKKIKEPKHSSGRMPFFLACAATAMSMWLPIAAFAQVNTGSDGSDGAFNPTVNTVINMADHPDGIYQYTSVNIPDGVTITFIPNANNTPVTWLLQGNCEIAGQVDVSGQGAPGVQGGLGGPGGWRGGTGGVQATSGQGPGGGAVGGGTANYLYANPFLVPLLGGSGGGGGMPGQYSTQGGGGGGGSGSLLIAVSGSMTLKGSVVATSGAPGPNGGYGSPGGIRFVAAKITGNGFILAPANLYGSQAGRVRFDTYENDFAGTINAQFTQGFQPIIIPAPGQIGQLTITSVAGTPVSASPTGVLSTPDVVISGQEANPIPVVVSCSGIPLNSQITVSVQPMNASPVTAVGANTTGTQASSTATVSLNFPRGGGLIYATVVAALGQTSSLNTGGKAASYAQTGLTANGERFVKAEIKAALGGHQEITYITPSEKRYSAPAK